MACRQIEIPETAADHPHRVALTDDMLTRITEILVWMRDEAPGGTFYESTLSLCLDGPATSENGNWLAFSDVRTARAFAKAFGADMPRFVIQGDQWAFPWTPSQGSAR